MDEALLIGGIIVAILLICMQNKPKPCGKRRHKRKLAPEVRYVTPEGGHSCMNHFPNSSYVEGSLGPTPYREDGIRKPGPTEHYNNKTNVLWMAATSQAGVDEDTGVSQDAISSEYPTPMRNRFSANRPSGPRLGETMPSHI